jgi:hypothetical protein
MNIEHPTSNIELRKKINFIRKLGRRKRRGLAETETKWIEETGNDLAN